jgi:hypothetical protein
MASTFMETAQRAGKGSFDIPVAALAAVSVAFVVFAMPADILTRLIELSRLPAILAAAEPPLGTKARLALSLVGSVASFAAVFYLLRALGRVPAKHREEPEPEFPKLRRSAFHPDAPARRPILAGRDFGEPDDKAEAPAAPFWHPEDFPIEPEEDQHEEQPDEPQEDDEEGELELGGPGTEMLEPTPPSAAQPPVQSAQPALRAQPVYVEPEPAEQNSIPDLMARLERGLSRRLEQKIYAQEAPGAAPPVYQDEGDDRLRSAIENLQRMALRAG